MADRNYFQWLLLAKEETTDGTDAAPTAAANAIACYEPFEHNGDPAFRTERPKIAGGAQLEGIAPLQPLGWQSEWSSKFFVRGTRNGLAYAAGNKVDLDPYYACLGLTRTLDATGGAEKVAVRPGAAGLVGITEYKYVDGQLFKLLGTRGRSGTFGFEAGGPLTLDVARIGLWQSPGGAALPTTQVFGAADPALFEDVALTIDGFAAGVISSFKWVVENQVHSARKNANAPGAIGTPRVRGRKLRWECVLEDPALTDKDFEALVRANTSIALGWFRNSAQYTRHRFAAPAARIETLQRSNADGTAIVTIGGGLYHSAVGAADAFTHTHE